MRYSRRNHEVVIEKLQTSTGNGIGKAGCKMGTKMKTSDESRRQRLVARLKRSISSSSYPRLQMIAILTITGSAGFLFSMISLQLGLKTIWLRYLIAIAFAYAVFLLLVRAWVAYHRSGLSFDLQLPNSGSFGSGSRSGTPTVTGGGGAFGGGGASGSFEDSAEAPAMLAVSEAVQSSSQGSGSSLPDVDVDADVGGALIVVIAIAAVAAALTASTYLIFVAPELLAELLLNGALGTGLYMRLRKIEPENWLRIVIRKTWIVALGVTVLFVAAGAAMHRYMPEARSMGDVWRLYK